jgi:hypothetical protein
LTDIAVWCRVTLLVDKERGLPYGKPLSRSSRTV